MSKEMNRVRFAYEKFMLLKAMNTIVRYMNDETAYLEWTYTIPDGADDEDLMEIAVEDEDTFAEACLDFKRICDDYLKHGLYISVDFRDHECKGLYGVPKKADAADAKDDDEEDDEE